MLRTLPSRVNRIENSTSGEIIEATRTAADTSGAHIEGYVTVPPGFNAIPLHRHQQQEEVFKVIRGKVGIELDGVTRFVVAARPARYPPMSRIVGGMIVTMNSTSTTGLHRRCTS